MFNRDARPSCRIAMKLWTRLLQNELVYTIHKRLA